MRCRVRVCLNLHSPRNWCSPTSTISAWKRGADAWTDWTGEEEDEETGDAEDGEDEANEDGLLDGDGDGEGVVGTVGCEEKREEKV